MRGTLKFLLNLSLKNRKDKKIVQQNQNGGPPQSFF